MAKSSASSSVQPSGARDRHAVALDEREPVGEHRPASSGRRVTSSIGRRRSPCPCSRTSRSTRRRGRRRDDAEHERADDATATMATLAPPDMPRRGGGPAGRRPTSPEAAPAGPGRAGTTCRRRRATSPGPCWLVAHVGSASGHPTMPAVPIRAAFFDFGGVILSSPFEAFNGFEERNGLPARLHPHDQLHEPRHQRVGPVRAQRGRASTSSATCSRPSAASRATRWPPAS